MPEARAAQSAPAWGFGAVAAGVLAALIAGVVGTSTIAAVMLAGVALAVAVVVLQKPERGLWLMLVALPLDTAGRLITSPVTVTFYHVTLLLTLAAWALLWLRDPVEGKPRFSAIDVGIGALLAAAVWSLPGSLAPQATIIAIVRLTFLWLFFIVFSTFMRDRRSIGRVVTIVVVTAAAAGLLALAQYLVPGLGIGNTHVQVGFGGSAVRRPAALFDDPNYLATFLSVGIIAAVGRAISARRVSHALAWVAAAAACSGGLLITFSRTGWIGVLLGLVLLAVMAPPARRRWLVTAMVSLALAAVAIAPGAIVSRLVSIANIQGDTSVGTRYLMLRSSVDIIRDNWVFGTGLSAFDRAYPAYRVPGALTSILKPHQLPLALWAEMGLPGLFAELLIAFAVVWVLAHRRHRGWNAYEAIGVAGFAAVLVQSLFQYYLYFEYLWLLLAITAAAARMTTDTEEVGR